MLMVDERGDLGDRVDEDEVEEQLKEARASVDFRVF